MGYQKYHEEDDEGWADIHTVDGRVTRVDVYRYDDSSSGHSHTVYGKDGEDLIYSRFGEDYTHDSGRHASRYEYDSDDDDNDSGSSRSSCFIATAVLPFSNRTLLLPLKLWRYEVMESTILGHLMSNYYRKTAPEIADKLKKHPRVSEALRNWFVLPAIRSSMTPKGVFRDLVLHAYFVSGYMIARLFAMVL